jgi:hypothetical protein
MPHLHGRTVTLAFALSTALVTGPTLVAQTPERLTDKDVSTLIETVDQGRDRFEDQLDGKVKDNSLRGPTGELNVSRFLDDFQENVKRLKDRFKPEYAASTEAANVLRQGTTIHNFMKQQSPDLKGSSEWDHLAGNLTKLAAAYATKFPLEGEAPVRRINDGEAAKAAEEIAGHADQLKNAVNKEANLARPAKDALKSAADVVKESAKTLRSRLSDSKPATAEARLLFEALSKFDASAKGAGLSGSSLSLMGTMRRPLATLQQAFGILGT